MLYIAMTTIAVSCQKMKTRVEDKQNMTKKRKEKRHIHTKEQTKCVTGNAKVFTLRKIMKMLGFPELYCKTKLPLSHMV